MLLPIGFGIMTKKTSDKNSDDVRRPLWRMKRYYVIGFFLFCWMLKYSESEFIDYLVAEQMKDHVNFEENFADLKTKHNIEGNFRENYQIVDDFGYKHRAFFRGTKNGNTIKYKYRRPRKSLSILDYLFYGSGKMYKEIVRITNGEVKKCKGKLDE